MHYSCGLNLAGGEVDRNRESAFAREPGDRRANPAAGSCDDESAQLLLVVGHVDRKEKAASRSGIRTAS
jgi:hypothetical protein